MLQSYTYKPIRLFWGEIMFFGSHGVTPGKMRCSFRQYHGLNGLHSNNIYHQYPVNSRTQQLFCTTSSLARKYTNDPYSLTQPMIFQKQQKMPKNIIEMVHSYLREYSVQLLGQPKVHIYTITNYINLQHCLEYVQCLHSGYYVSPSTVICIIFVGLMSIFSYYWNTEGSFTLKVGYQDS